MASALEDLLDAAHRSSGHDVVLEKLLVDGASDELAQYVKERGPCQETVRLVDSCLQALRKGVLPPCQDMAEERLQKCREEATGAVVEMALLMMSGDGEERDLAAFPHLLLDHIDVLSFPQLAKLLASVCDGVKDRARGTGRLLQLLPKTASMLLAHGAPEDEAQEAEAEEAGKRKGGAVPSPAANQVNTAVTRLCQMDWVRGPDWDFAVPIMEALREVPLSLLQLKDVVTKAGTVCASAELAALPGLLRQLLRLAGLGHRALVLRKVLALFERLEAQHRTAAGAPSAVLQAVEGTALVTIADVCKYDSALSKELLNLVVSSPSTPSPFCLLLLFTLLRQHKQEEKKLVLGAFEWDSTRASSAWLGSLPALPRPAGQALQAALLRAVRYSGVGGEVVVPGITALGAALMGCCPPGEALALVAANDAALAEAEAEVEAEAEARKAQRRAQRQQAQGLAGGSEPQQPQPQAAPQAAAAGGRGGPSPAQAAASRCSPGVQAALLGIQLLQATFKSHPESRPDVLRLCQQALGGVCSSGAAAAASAAAGGGLGAPGQELALPAVLLLSNLAACHPTLLYEHTQRLKDSLQNFLLLPAPVALGLLLGLWPLARNRRDLSDHLVMLLRKVMFAREAQSRLVAVRGFLFILLQQLRAAAGRGCSEDEEAALLAAAAAMAAAGPSFSQASSSQSPLSQMEALASGAGVSLQHELQGFLRRALGQQAAVRAALYDGLSAILVADPASRDVVLELVGPQFYRYLNPAMPPLHYKALVSGNDSVQLLEPLPSLLACVRRLATLCRDPSKPGPAARLLAAASEEVVIGDDDEEEEEADAAMGADEAVQHLVSSWEGFARRLVDCHAEHFDLCSAAELNPTTSSGAARQLQAACVLGAVEVVMEELVAVATGPHAAETASRSGERLSTAFDLYCRVYDVAREAKATTGARAKQAATQAAAASHEGSGGTGPNGTAAPGGAAGAGAAGAAAGCKRGRELCPDYVPVESRPVAMTAQCLGKLCGGVSMQGLVQCPASEESDGPSAHARLARNPAFRAFVLRGCLNALRASGSGGGGTASSSSSSTSSSAVLADAVVACAQRRLGRQAQRENHAADVGVGPAPGSAGLGLGMGMGMGGAGGAGGAAAAAGSLGDAPWRPLAQPLVHLCHLVLTTWSGPSKKPPAPKKAAAAAAPMAAAAAEQQRREAAAADSLAGLAVACLREALGAAAALGGLEGVAWVLRGLPIHCQETQAQVDETDLPPEDIVAARWPHLGDMLDALARAASWKEAAALVEVVVAVARLLPAPAQRAVSDACWLLLQQEEPVMTHAGLARALVSAHVTLRGTDDLAAMRSVAEHAQAVVGRTDAATQEDADIPAGLNERTAPFAATQVLIQAQGCVAEGEVLLASVLRGSGEDAAPGGVSLSSTTTHLLVEALCRRLQGLVGVLSVVTNSKHGTPQVLEKQADVVIGTYRLLGKLARAHLPRKGAAAAAGPKPPPIKRPFQELASCVHRELTPNVYKALVDELAASNPVQRGPDEEGDEPGGGAPKQTTAKLRRDAKAFSDLIHAIEEWEKQLLALDKAHKSQGLNLMRGASRSINRDFQFAKQPRKAAGNGGGAEDVAERAGRGGE
ncbi:hypothetical protein HYH03_011369 [Edaphochlamys debaryana]|uniref:Uncharacterized protein n=1 Tax=Edaphochlamys debaryana TaxID=47281 RepID=A0A835XUY2_9CHLO|nr:hypothetical protein HYH03_011369 [Edaphochlamys debaryana]|eukprot:KAG2490245.1 hypothetical protein HYH03_011369 [Edaphochlamys debaryana]